MDLRIQLEITMKIGIDVDPDKLARCISTLGTAWADLETEEQQDASRAAVNLLQTLYLTARKKAREEGMRADIVPMPKTLKIL